jgi:hypothetical protein
MYITYPQKIITSTFLTFFLTCFVHVLHAQLNIDKNKLAVSGYDLVDYFNGKASPGNENFLSCYKGATIFLKMKLTKELLKKAQKNIFLNMEAGVLTRWDTMGKK